MHRGRKYALVAGGAGFIGSHLVDSLVNDDWFVDVVDNFSTGRTDNVKHLLSRVLDDEQTVFVRRLDVVVMQSLTNVARDDDRKVSTYDVVYNLACPASPKAYQADGLGTIMTNIVGTANLLAVAKANRSVFVQASTSEVYGDPLEHPQHESYHGNVNPFGIRACYDEGKRCAETICYEFLKSNVDVRVARIFNTYGPRMDPDDGRVVSSFIRQAILGEALTIYGDGEQTRSFCYVDDLVRSLRLLADAKNITLETPMNIGNDGEFKIVELAEMLSEWFPKLITVRANLPADDPRVRKPDLSFAKSVLGYSPQVSLREGLVKTIEWMRDRLIKDSS